MLSSTLLSQVKRKLNITWNDDVTIARIEEIIEDATSDLIHRLGIAEVDFDFSVPGAENILFLAYCLYEWNHALNEFDENYARLIAQVRAKHEVAQFVKREETTDAEV